jgi:hypothetical protein
MDTTQTIQCTTACTITLVVQPAVATQEMYDAANTLFGGILAAMVAVWGMKRLLRLFQKPSEA